MDIQVILFNSIKHLPRFASAINLVHRNSPVTIHFLENSEEKTEKYLKTLPIEFPYTYKVYEENVGFGSGHNRIFAENSPKYGSQFCIMNPDSILRYDAISKLEVFRENLQDTWGAVDMHILPQEHPKDFDADTFETEWVSGAATLFKTDVFKEVGGFDEHIFMYNEDVDISWRIREAGYTLHHCPSAKIFHGSSYIDLTKKTHFPNVHMKATGLYLRQKYFDTSEFRKYKKLLESFPDDFSEVWAVYQEIVERVGKKSLKAFKSYTVPKLYPDTHYAKHRW